MSKLLQINVTANSGSTGKIAEQVNQVAQSKGWKTYLAYGRNLQPCKSELVHIGNNLQVYLHYAEHRLFDNDGLASRIATRHLVHKIKEIKPDIIHLHNIHDHWLNYRILFEYLNSVDTPVIWTQHDCWAFTGGCFHFTCRNCYRWREGGCSRRCPMKQNKIMRKLFEKTTKHYSLKRELFSANRNLILVPVSNWLENLERQSFLKHHRIITIHNGVDISAFQPTDSTNVRQKYGIGEQHYVLGVSSVWLPYKGWNDFLRLPKLLPQGVKLVLVGLKKEQLAIVAKEGIIGIPRTENLGELAALYSGATIFCNFTYEDNYPTTNLEAMASGTPVLTYRTGGSPEAVTIETGWVVEQGDIAEAAKIINGWINAIECTPSVGEEMRQNCRKRAEQEFNKEARFEEYIKLYNELLNK